MIRDCSIILENEPSAKKFDSGDDLRCVYVAGLPLGQSLAVPRIGRLRVIAVMRAPSSRISLGASAPHNDRSSRIL